MCSRDSGGAAGAIRTRRLAEGLEAVETSGLLSGYAPHSHDSYVVGLTAEGIQRFRYRGEERASAPGQAFVLHPGELHDGRPGGAGGYGYRAVYLAPWHVAEAGAGRALPFVAGGLSLDRGLLAAIAKLLEAADAGAEALAIDEGLVDLALVLQRLGGRSGRCRAARYRTLCRVREQLHFDWRPGLRLADLEAEHGISRFAIARDFCRYFGVSPSRYLVLRRLDRARQLIGEGLSLAEAAQDARFADQSHMTRQFLRAFGLTPGRWRALQRRPAPHQAR